MSHQPDSDQRAVPCMLMRGGTSRGPFFLESDLPAETAARDRLLLAAMGSPDPRQIDGLGGAHPLTSKVGIVRRSATPGVDLDFLFAQLQPNNDTVDVTPNCGNMLAAVLPFALERGLLPIADGATTARILTLNTGMRCDVTVQTPGGKLQYSGEARIDGVPGAAAPISINFLDTAGSVCPSLLPTGRTLDRINVGAAVTPSAAAPAPPPTATDSALTAVAAPAAAPFAVDATLIDNGMPMVLVRASAFGITGYESAAELTANDALRARLEALRLAAGPLMGLGDVTKKNYPKMCLIAPPRDGGAVSTRCFIPHVCHDSIGVLAAVTVATACVLEGAIADGIAAVPAGAVKTLSIEHPTGEFSVELETDQTGQVVRAALLRTARPIMRGEVLVPAHL
ncbi:4-oxalomesaconate tautomerase [Duganella radicis]|uniref:4-oxalomesaconate tautomerase n=1 Tax=Duganella radicis TaxID=551988 RepID=A0A6L6PDT1_9BURK|nr:4-oxalomesaconate tautomerase [Duganella radicis]MTV36869.1 4-oxalomesaconate tautomerase [Duganella radicis]